MKFLPATGLGCLLLLSACATPTTQRPEVSSAETKAEEQNQAEYLVKSRMAEENRVLQVAERLFAANLEHCPAKTPVVGMRYATIHTFSPQLRPAVKTVLSLNESPQIIRVSTGSPAEKAGLKTGDILLAVNGQSIKPGPRAVGDIKAALNQARAKTETSQLRLQRGSEEIEVFVTPEETCAYEVTLEESDQINAYADGSRIIITRGLLRFVQSDDELALILAHELAHNTESHMQAARKNQAAGAAGGFLLDLAAAAAGVDTGGAFTDAGMKAGSNYASPEFEEEADYVGAYYMVRAGFSVDNVSDFWRRMSVEAPQSIFVRSSHPANPQRYVKLGATLREIEDKRRLGTSLVPNRKSQ